jgi:hypothetical protein
MAPITTCSTLDDLLPPIAAAGDDRMRLPRVTVAGYGDVMRMKEALPASLAITSLRDFGGCYLVHGRYLLHAARARRLSLASMVDVNPLPEFAAAAATLCAEQPGTSVETIHGDFREPRLYERLAPTDAALLYEVLLHQENYVEVLKQVAATTTRYICIAQPCLREELFPLPASAVLLQFHDDALKDLLRVGSFWPKEPRSERFTTAHWMWGHTTSHLIDVMRGVGWVPIDGSVVDGVCGPCWEYPLLVFARR